jgi:hypothetical protein
MTEDQRVLGDIKKYVEDQREIPRQLVLWMIDQIDRSWTEVEALRAENEEFRALLDEYEREIALMKETG